MAWDKSACGSKSSSELNQERSKSVENLNVSGKQKTTSRGSVTSDIPTEGSGQTRIGRKSRTPLRYREESLGESDKSEKEPKGKNMQKKLNDSQNKIGKVKRVRVQCIEDKLSERSTEDRQIEDSDMSVTETVTSDTEKDDHSEKQLKEKSK